MTTYTLTVSTNDLGLGVINGARVVVERKRTQVTDIFGGQSLSKNTTATNSSGIATVLLKPDDGSVYHEIKIFDLAGIPVYSTIFSMPPQAVAVTELPVQDIISSSATQAVAASVTATEQAVISTEQASVATTKAEEAETSASTATTKAAEAAASAASIRVDSATYAAIPALTTSCFVFVAADETNDNLPTVYFFDGSGLQWLPSVGV